jgi:hypothetical protein
MRLSASQFERIVKADVSTATNARAAIVPAGCRVSAERRATARVSLGRRIQLRVGTGRWQTVVVRDVSETGLSVLADTEFAAGDLFTVRFQTGPGRHLTIASKVCWSEPGGYERAGHLIGASFERVIEQQAYVLQGAPAAAGNPPAEAEAPVPADRRRRFGFGSAAAAVLEGGRALLRRGSVAG